MDPIYLVLNDGTTQQVYFSGQRFETPSQRLYLEGWIHIASVLSWTHQCSKVWSTIVHQVCNGTILDLVYFNGPTQLVYFAGPSNISKHGPLKSTRIGWSTKVHQVRNGTILDLVYFNGPTQLVHFAGPSNISKHGPLKSTRIGGVR